MFTRILYTLVSDFFPYLFEREFKHDCRNRYMKIIQERILYMILLTCNPSNSGESYMGGKKVFYEKKFHFLGLFNKRMFMNKQGEPQNV